MNLPRLHKAAHPDAPGPAELRMLAPNRQIALVTQEMAVFGGSGPGTGLTVRQHESGLFDYFA